MQVDVIQVVGALAAAPVVWLAGACVRAWVEERRLKRRLQITEALPEGSTLSERFPDGTSVRITLGPRKLSTRGRRANRT
ncbi:hypothetical protein ACFXKD_00645 [Nocardiopsis aegyptia]|uniref:hypothetical protein n=1 Tax=Nocardiopsis aegyptia TaxID=220378 RepID=UPI00366B519B